MGGGRWGSVRDCSGWCLGSRLGLARGSGLWTFFAKDAGLGGEGRGGKFGMGEYCWGIVQ